MKKKRLFFILLMVLTFVMACNNNTSQRVNPTVNLKAEDILSGNKDADIFVYNGIVYQNANDIKWVNDLPLTRGEVVLKITSQTQDGKVFKNGTATKLLKGTKIYSPVERYGPILIAVVDGKDIRYLGLVEG